MNYLPQQDPQVFAAIEQERKRQHAKIELIASEKSSFSPNASKMLPPSASLYEPSHC